MSHIRGCLVNCLNRAKLHFHYRDLRHVNTAFQLTSSLRNTMSDNRLSSLGALSTEARRARAMNLDDFVDAFRHENDGAKLF